MFKKWRALALFWLLLGIANLVRAAVAYRLTEALEAHPPAVALPLLGWVYAVWGAAFLVSAALTWRRRAQRGAVWLTLAYQAGLWIVRLGAYRSDYARSLWARDLLLTGLFILLIAWLTHDKQSQRMERRQRLADEQ